MSTQSTLATRNTPLFFLFLLQSTRIIISPTLTCVQYEFEIILSLTVCKGEPMVHLIGGGISYQFWQFGWKWQQKISPKQIPKAPDSEDVSNE